MKQIMVSAALLILFSTTLFAGWSQTYGGDEDEWAWSVQETTDGGFITVGWTMSSGSGLADVYLIKTDTQVNEVWSKTYGGTQYDAALSVQETTDGGFILAGTRDATQFGGGNIWIIKTEENGDSVWTKTYGGTDGDEAWCVRVLEDGYIIAGSVDINEVGCPTGKVWLLKTDKSGDTVWTRTFGVDTLLERSFHVEPTIDGGFIICGKWAQYPFLLKTDSYGIETWLKVYEYINGQAFCVDQSFDGGYILTGQIIESNQSDLWVLKTDSQGDTIWNKYYTGLGEEFGYGLKASDDGGCVVTGVKDFIYPNTGGDLWLLKLDSDGDTMWTRTYGESGTDWGHCVDLTSDGGYIVAGYFDNQSISGKDAWLIKTDSLGIVTITEDSESHELDWAISSSIGSSITLSYTDHPQGFHADVFDASGRKVDELNSSQTYGTVTWPQSSSRIESGVYFIKSSHQNEVHKFILVE